MLIKNRNTYYYDTETCTFHKAEFSWNDFYKKSAKYFGLAILAAVGAWYFYTQKINNLKEHELQAQNTALLAYLDDQNTTLDDYEKALDVMLDRDKALYSTILNSDAIQPSIWEGGRGGSQKYSKNPGITEGTEIRIENIQHRIKLLENNLLKYETLKEKLNKDLKNMPSILPVKGQLISGFGHRTHPISGMGHFHTGLDFACPMGTKIYASGDGVVVFADRNDSGYGIHVNIDHLNGYETKYAHLSELAVKQGEIVKRGDIIGYAGSTGRSSGPHLHYEIKFNGERIDPMDFFYIDMLPVEFLQMKVQAQKNVPPMDY